MSRKCSRLFTPFGRLVPVMRRLAEFYWVIDVRHTFMSWNSQLRFDVTSALDTNSIDEILITPITHLPGGRPAERYSIVWANGIRIRKLILSPHRSTELSGAEFFRNSLRHAFLQYPELEVTGSASDFARGCSRHGSSNSPRSAKAHRWRELPGMQFFERLTHAHSRTRAATASENLVRIELPQRLRCRHL